ncbi:MAG: hypothetical protein JSS96_02000 [Bacteroidetes bacterium]|nr:hypothetical protein [Bacteroidota bacterium]
MKASKLFFVSILLLLVTGCGKRQLNAVDYVHYVQADKNHLKKAVKMQDMEFDIQYKPYDYIVLLESRNDPAYDREKRMKQLAGTAWFNISFRKTNTEISALKEGATSLNDYDQRLNYFLNYASKDIVLIYGSDTLKPVSYLFENNYNVGPVETMVVGFVFPGKDTVPLKDMQINYYDRLFHNGIIKASFSAETLKDIPNLLNTNNKI